MTSCKHDNRSKAFTSVDGEQTAECHGCEQAVALVCACGCNIRLAKAKRQARNNPGYLNEYQAEASVHGAWVLLSEVHE